MPLKTGDLDTLEAYRKALKRDAARIIAGDKLKFWIYKNVVLASAAGKVQKPALLVALVSNREVKLEEPLQGKKPVCTGMCGLQDGRVAFEATAGVVPYGRLKGIVPVLMGKPLHIPEGVVLEEEGAEGEEGQPETGVKPKEPTKPALSAGDLQAAMNKLTPHIKSAVEANADKKKEILGPVAAFTELLKANKLENASQKLVEIGAALKGLGALITDTIESKAKADFEQKFAPLKGRADKLAGADATLFGMAKPLQDLNAALKVIADKQAAKDYAEAARLLADLDNKITAAETLLAASNAAKKTVDGEWKALDADLKKAEAVFPSTDALKAARKKYSEARNGLATKYQAKDYAAAATFVEPLKTAVKELLKAAADNDKVAAPKAAAAEKAIKELVKKKQLAGKNNAEKIQLLHDLRGPSTKMTPEFRAAQRAVYKSLKLDPKFVEEDKKKRKEIIKALVPSKVEKKEFKEKRKNWKKLSDDEKLAMIKKAVAAQSRTLGIPVPEIVKVNEPVKDGLITNGYFNPEDGKIYINLNPASSVHDFEKAIDLAFHENSHNYQNELVKKLKEGKLDKKDPAYEEATLFAINDEPQAYVEGAEDFDTYKKQPMEEHSHLNGPQTAKALIKAIR